MQHRIYNLASKQTFLGVDLSDILVGMTVWLLGNFLAGEFLPPRLRILSIFLAIGLALTLWRSFKDKLPPGFFRHLYAWATEANLYRIGPDTKARPAVVDHRRVLGFLEQEKRDRRGLGDAVPRSHRVAALRPKLHHEVRLVPPPRTAAGVATETSTSSPRAVVGRAE